MARLTHAQRKRILFPLFLANFTAIAAGESYLPSLPFIETSLSLAAHIAQLSISVFFLGFGLCQFFYGPASDYLGRRPILLTGLAIGLGGTLLALVAEQAISLLMARLLQGLGFGSIAIIARAIIRDVYAHYSLAKASSWLGMISSAALGLSPLLGGVIQHYSHWRVNFVIILLLSALSLVLAYYALPETRHSRPNQPLRLVGVLAQYAQILSERYFVLLTLSSALAFAVPVAYISIAPFWLQNQLSLSALQFGWLSVLMFIAKTIGLLLNIGLIKYLDIRVNMLLGFIGIGLSGLLLLLFSAVQPQTATSLALPVFIAMAAAGLIFPNAFALAFAAYKHNIGTRSSVYGGLQILWVAIISILVASQTLREPVVITCTAFLTLIIGLMCVYYLRNSGDRHYKP